MYEARHLSKFEIYMNNILVIQKKNIGKPYEISIVVNVEQKKNNGSEFT